MAPAPTEHPAGQAAQRRTSGRLSRGGRLWLYALAVLVALSLARVVTGADDLTSAGTLRAAIIAAIPIALAGLGGLWSERAGVVNIGLEGMMILGTLGAGYYTYYQGVWIGLLGAIMFGAIGGALHALATVVFAVDHIVSGVAINIIAAGVAAFLAEVFFADLAGGGATQSPSLAQPPSITVPGIAGWSDDLADRGWFVVSDLAGLVNALTADVSSFTVLALALIAGTGWVLWHTGFGLRLRSCGEAPTSAETLGINVYRYKFVAVTVSGMFAGFGGCYLALVASSGYANGQTGGRGYIGLAAMIFGNWSPGGLLSGSLLFGFTEGARLRSGGESVHALLLVVALGLLVLAGWQIWKGHRTAAVLSAAVGAAALWWYLVTDTIPGDFTEMTPYVTTLLVLALASQRLRMPAADGQRYRRGQAG
ncbi:MAG: ABC transporter permease [Actinomycetota bacterium]|nr:ABC transporter permease [Nocardioidaceae bacterium]MDQ3592187.1 ABC transporter permease [Actinomycetota bacterium]